MSELSVYKCDACGEKSEGITRTWRQIEIETADNSIGSKPYFGNRRRIHACSKKCAAHVLRSLAEEIAPTETPNGPVPSQGPYR